MLAVIAQLKFLYALSLCIILNVIHIANVLQVIILIGGEIVKPSMLSV